MRVRAGLALVSAIVVLAACGGTADPGTEQAAAAATSPAASTTVVATAAPLGVPALSHVFIIVLENHEAGQILGNPAMAYLNGLATRYARADNFYAIAHPSLPNYLALTGGSTFGVTSDCARCFVDAPNIADQIEAAGRSWKAYMEGMPRPCFIGDAPPYAQKHDPFIYYDAIRTNPGRRRRIVPFTDLAADLAAHTVPDFAWITPDMCHDMHDCPPGTADAWLAQEVPAILDSPEWQQDGALFITFDEGSSNAGCCRYAAGGRVVTLVISPRAKSGYVSNAAYDHYSLLRTIEAGFGLSPLAGADCACSPVMTDVWPP